MDPFQTWVEETETGLRELRARLGTWLERCGLDEEARADVVLATHEAAANALEHADPHGPVLVRAARRPEEVVVEVFDRGRWKERDVPRPEERGRGLDLIRWLVSDADITVGREGTTVRMRRRVGMRDADMSWAGRSVA